MTAAPLPRPLRGIVPPLVTPLVEPDRLDVDAVDRLVEHLAAGGVSGLFVLGTTGEGPALSYRIRYEVVERVCQQAAGRLPVLVGITDTSWSESLELARWSCDCGASAVVAAPPYYFSMNEEELGGWFVSLAEASPLPLVLYNMPGCTKVSLGLPVLTRLTQVENIVGLKDSSGDLESFRAATGLLAVRPDWSVLMGPEELLIEAVDAGGHGGVCGGANLAPRLFVELYEAAVAKDGERTARSRKQAARLGQLYSIAAPPSAYLRGLKGALTEAGLCGPALAPPFAPLSPDEQANVRTILRELGLEVPAGV
jgi:4-hydroxy-tetrahydrodipicolinate synthase